MRIKRGEVWLADLNPIRGSEQAGIRPVLLFQNDDISRLTHRLGSLAAKTVIAVERTVLFTMGIVLGPTLTN